MLVGNASPLLRIGAWLVDPSLDTLSQPGTVQKLEPRTMRLLLVLAESPGKVVSVERMLAEVWPGVVVGPASVYQAVSRLRRLLGDTDPDPTYIATVPRKGYRLVAAVQSVETEPAAQQGPTAQPEPDRQLQSHPELRSPPGAQTQPEPQSQPASQSRPGPQSQPERRSRADRRSQPTPVRRGWSWRRAFPAVAALVAIGLAVFGWLHFEKPPPAALEEASVVVLPFIDMTTEKHDQAFCDGLTEELSNWLAQIPNLRVVARTSAFAYRGKNVDVRTIGRELGTSHALEGSLRRSGNQLRVTAQLVSTRDGYHVWSATFDRPMDDVVKVQEEIARSVADNLEIRLTGPTAKRLTARRGGSPQSYELYLLARYHQQLLTRDSNNRAIELYRQALVLDNRFALAYAGLARAYINQSYLGGLSVQEVADQVEPLLVAGLRLNPELPELYTARGALRSDQGRFAEALLDLRRAISLNSNDSEALAAMGYLFITNGQPREALSSYSAAALLDPLDFNLHARRCIALTDMARYDEADVACMHARALAPSGSWAYVATSWLDWARGRIDAALKWNGLAIKASPDEFDLYDDRANLLLTLGLTAEARRALEEARSATGSEERAAVRLAQVSYYEGGESALRAQMAAAHVESSTHADTLFLAAREELMLHDAAAARRLLDKALAAPDLGPRALDDPWYERQGESEDVVFALAELGVGERDSAQRRLDALLARLDRLRQGSVERYGVYKLRAAALTLRGDFDGAMSALGHAADMGWREATQAMHDPVFAPLQSRSDFQLLMGRVQGEDLQMRSRISPPPAD
jgi:TolB-like protein/DNA-binding winged helix-turn-helix (wHTH) protein/tetratricopeptide (TPR) repeat protein